MTKLEIPGYIEVPIATRISAILTTSPHHNRLDEIMDLIRPYLTPPPTGDISMKEGEQIILREVRVSLNNAIEVVNMAEKPDKQFGFGALTELRTKLVHQNLAPALAKLDKLLSKTRGE